MKLLWRIRRDTSVTKCVNLVGESYDKVYYLDTYFEHTTYADKFVIIYTNEKFWVIDNNKMYDYLGDFIDNLNLDDHQKFSTEEEAIMYAITCF